MEPGGKCYFLRVIVLPKCFESRLPTYKPYNKAHRLIVTRLYVHNDNKESQLKICSSEKSTIHGFTIEVDILFVLNGMMITIISF